MNLFNNKVILVGGKPISISVWFNNNLLFILDLLNGNGQSMSYQEFKNKSANKCLQRLQNIHLSKNSGIVRGQTLQVARRKCLAKRCFDIQKKGFWRKINAFSRRVYRKRILAVFDM